MKLKQVLESQLGLSEVLITDSGTWYKQSFDTAGNWDSWIWETVLGRDYETRDRHFSGFVVYGDRLGRATAGVCNLALRSDRAVLVFDGQRLGKVTSVVTVDQENMVSGWTVDVSAIGGV